MEDKEVGIDKCRVHMEIEEKMSFTYANKKNTGLENAKAPLFLHWNCISFLISISVGK